VQAFEMFLLLQFTNLVLFRFLFVEELPFQFPPLGRGREFR